MNGVVFPIDYELSKISKELESQNGIGVFLARDFRKMFGYGKLRKEKNIKIIVDKLSYHDISVCYLDQGVPRFDEFPCNEKATVLLYKPSFGFGKLIEIASRNPTD